MWTGAQNSSGHLNSLPVFRGVHVAQSLVFCVMFCRLLFILVSLFLSFCCLSFIDYYFWLTLLHFQTFLSIGICCGIFVFNEWIKRKKYHTVGTVLKSNRQIVEREVKGGIKNRMIIILQCITCIGLMCPIVATCLSVATVDIQPIVLVYYKADLIIISLKIKISCCHSEDTQTCVLTWVDQDKEDFLNIIRFLIGLKNLVD
jgi:hypothetical protein